MVSAQGPEMNKEALDSRKWSFPGLRWPELAEKVARKLDSEPAKQRYVIFSFVVDGFFSLHAGRSSSSVAGLLLRGFSSDSSGPCSSPLMFRIFLRGMRVYMEHGRLARKIWIATWKRGG